MTQDDDDGPDPDADIFEGSGRPRGHRGVLDRTALDTPEKLRAHVHERACREFDRFVVKKEGDGRWRCGRPGSSAYSFWVILCPGRVVFTGDTGDLILRVSTADPLEWLKTTLLDGRDEIEYLLGKAPQDARERTWMPGTALEELRSWLKDRESDAPDREEWPEKHAKAMKKTRDEFKDVLEDLSLADEDRAEDAWADACIKLGWEPCDGLPEATYWSMKMLCVYEGLRWFVHQLGPDGR